LAHQIEGKGVQIGYCGLIVQFTEPVSSIPDEIDRAKALIDAMPDLGVDAIRIPGNGVVDDQTLEFTFDAVKAKLLTICEYAADAGINVYLHNHNHGSTPSTGAQVLRMLDEIDNPALSYVVDTGQFQGSPGAGGFGSPDNGAKPELYESIEMVVPRASMSRTKFYFANNGDEQWLDYPRIVRIFKKANFTGPLSIVYEPRGKLLSKDALPKAVKYLTELMQKDLYTLR
jgi:hypothetical protein